MVTVVVEVQLSADVWTDLSADLNAVSGLRAHYGLTGNRPLDLVAGTGECEFWLKNHAGNSAATQGYYSPLHASVRAGWTVGIPCRVRFVDGSDAVQSVTALTRASSTATATLVGHGYSTGDYVTIAGADQSEYTGTAQIAVTDPDTFTYAVSGTPATPATGTITAQRCYVKHRGKVRLIDPLPGRYGPQLVRVVSYDGMRDLGEADLREVDLQVNQGEDDLVTAVLDALPSAAQPLARDLDAGVDTHPYAFDEIGRGTKALSVLSDIAASSFALIFMKGDGTLRLQSRNTRAAGASAYTFATDSMHGLEVPVDVELLHNLVRVTIHPRTIDAAATTVVYSTTGTVPSVAAGETLTLWVEYRTPDETRVLIGALDVVSPLVASTDYAGNAAADGSGADLTADLDVTLTPFASTAKIEIANTGTQTVYLVDGSGNPFLQIRGKGVYDLGPRTFQAESVQNYGQRPLDVDLPYQSNATIAQSYAIYLQAQYSTLVSQLGTLEFLANDSAAFLTQALAREPGDLITLSETVTGIAAVEAVIHRVEIELRPGPWMVCRWLLAPAAPFKAWLLGVVGRSELGTTTRLGF
jgi:hypothetical protein